MENGWPFSFPACSCMTLHSRTGKPYWFRTCDIETDLWKEGAHVAGYGRESKLKLAGQNEQSVQYAFLGVTYNENNSWLLDGMNEAGLAGGLLMLPEATSVPRAKEGNEGCMGMELVGRLLAHCENVEEVKQEADKMQILDVPYRDGSVPASMHYFFVDAAGNEVILEATDERNPGKLRIYGREEGIGVMTNSPPYPLQLENLSWFISQSPELKQGLKGKPIDSLSWDNRTITGNFKAKHVSLNGTFPGSYSSHDRFIRLSVLKALNNSGNHFSDENMLVLGGNLMNAVNEPSTGGIFHYSRIGADGTVEGQKDSCTHYLVMYDILGRELYLKRRDTVVWSRYRLEELINTHSFEPLVHYPGNKAGEGIRQRSFLDKG